MTSMPHLAVMDWDYADRLRHTQKGAGSGAQHTYFTYDAAGQRARKVAVTSGTVKERIYLGGYEVYRERAAAPGAPIEFERQTLHVMDDQRRVAMAETKTREGGAVVPTLTTRWRFQLDNHLGSATLELDASGKVISYEEYHPYGSTAFHTADGGAQVSAKRYRYTGKEKDEETGLYYHGARYYAPWLGRWTAVDPIGITGGLNLYRYSRDNPIMFSDPGGTAPFASPGSNDYKVGTSTDPELIGYLKGLSPEQRGDFVAGATGKFQARTQAALEAANLGVTFTVTGTQSEATAQSNSEETGGQPVLSQIRSSSNQAAPR
jgi:RHS repeat-associated protein